MKWIFRLFSLAYVIALGLYLGETFGWFGQQAEPLADKMLRPLGLPWNLWFSGDDTLGFLVALLAPAVNLGILWLASDLSSSRED